MARLLHSVTVTGRAGRWGSAATRAVTFALVCVALAALAHRPAAGPAPAAWAVAAAVPVLALLALPLTVSRAATGRSATGRSALGRPARRSRPFPVVAGAMVAFQTGLHVTFGLTAPGAGHHSVFDRLLCQGSAGHHASAELTRRFLALHPGATGTGSPAVRPDHLTALLSPGTAPGTGAGLLMLGAHLIAAVAAAGWLYRTDAAVARAGILVSALIAAGRRQCAGRRPGVAAIIAAAVGAHGGGAALSRRRDQPPPATPWWFRTPTRRGPPIFA